jgi:pimeloyl-ACP methyl ester carboxylesterase
MLEYGPARALSEIRRMILPDMRGHGESAHPDDQEAYPPDVLADDGLALLEHLGLTDYDLGGYSLGARVALRLLARGAQPGRAILAGQGLDVLEPATTRTGGYRKLLTDLASGKVQPDEWTKGVHPQALLHVLDSMAGTPEATLARIITPTLVVVGDADHSHPGADTLAAALPNGRFATVPGDHGTAFQAPELTTTITAFLDD